MKDENLINTSKDFEQLLGYIRQTRQKVFQQANTALIDLYWQIGKVLCEKTENEGWGKGIVAKFAQYIAQNAPEIKGFSDKNLWRMKQFYETYRENEKLSTLVRELSWSHNLTIFSRCKAVEVVEYSLSRNLSPALVAQYQLHLPDKKLLKAKLHEIIESANPKNPNTDR